jgi:hypothetical protein
VSVKWAPVLVAGLLVVSCGGGSEGGSDDGVVETVSYGESSPLGRFFAGAAGQQAALSDFQRQAQELIQACMAKEGFEFAIAVPQVPESEQLRYDLTELEWTERYGYGISTSFESVIAAQGADPNTQIVLALGADEQEAWQSALLGQAIATGQVTDPSLMPPVSEQGCSGAAVSELGGTETVEGIGEFGVAYGDVFEELIADPAMVDASDGWSRCMAERGWDFGTQDDAVTYVSDEVDRATSSLGSELANLSADQLEALFEGSSIDPDDLPGFDRAALDAVREEEIEIALADLECYGEHVAAVFEPLRDAAEERLIEEYRPVLEGFRDLSSNSAD